MKDGQRDLPLHRLWCSTCRESSPHGLYEMPRLPQAVRVKVLVCGSRSWNHYAMVRRRLAKLPRGTEIIHGGARGADARAGMAARALGLAETVYPADWRGKGKRAGIIRNLEMLDQKPELVIAFWDGRSTGTQHTIGEAMRRGIDVEVIEP